MFGCLWPGQLYGKALLLPGMTCTGRVPNLIMPRRCYSRRFLPIMPDCGGHSLSCPVLDPAAALGRHPPWRLKIGVRGLGSCSVWLLPRHPCFKLMCHQGCAAASPHPRKRWRAFAFRVGLPSARGCSSCSLVPFLPRRPCLRLVLVCTCSPL